MQTTWHETPPLQYISLPIHTIEIRILLAIGDLAKEISKATGKMAIGFWAPIEVRDNFV